MNIVLTTLNAKFIHTCLALYCLQSYGKTRFKLDPIIREFNINQSLDYITVEIMSTDPHIVAFACYIWNIEQVVKLCSRLKKIRPTLTIVLGGPEVSFDCGDLLDNHPSVDFIIAGEGEITLGELCLALQSSPGNLAGIPGLWFRTTSGTAACSGIRPLIPNLDILPYPYPDDLSVFNHRILYYETSRGCPFSCQYCLSSTIPGVRMSSPEKVKNDLRRLMQAAVRQVKFVDRTFNCDSRRALELMQFMVQENPYGTAFHFEVAADLLTDEILQFLHTVPPGQFQLEIGVQSTYQPTLELIRRPADFQQISAHTSTIKQAGNMQLHLDLIAGLPGESYTRFCQSFDDVFRLHPDQLQLGFLKLLKGCGLRNQAIQYGYQFTSDPPYEVLSNNWLSYQQLTQLKLVEDLVQHYYNSYLCQHTLRYLSDNGHPSPSGLLLQFADEWRTCGYHHAAHSSKELFAILAAFIRQQLPHPQQALELLKFELLCAERTLQLPDWAYNCRPDDYQHSFYQLLSDAQQMSAALPGYNDQNPREISKHTQVELFAFDVPSYLKTGSWQETPTAVLFDYHQRHPVHHRAAYRKVQLK